MTMTLATLRELNHPFWLKPVKLFSSELAFRVDDRAACQEALGEIREGIGRVGKPFEYVLSHLELPAEIARVGGQACPAEEAMAGGQATVEGYSLDGNICVYGAVDSLTYPDLPSFERFQYPSPLPGGVTDRMEDSSCRVIAQDGT